MSQDDFDYIMTDLRLKKEKYLKAQEKMAKENEALKKQNEKKAQEIKQLKEEAKQTPTPALVTEPTLMNTPISTTTIRLESEKASDEVIILKLSDYNLLKKRYAIATTAMVAVLAFIVPQNLRDLVNKAIKDIGESDKQ